MNNIVRIGNKEAVGLMSIVIFTKILYTSTTVMVQLTGTAAWYMTIISCITAMFFFLLLCILLKRFDGYDLIDIFEIVLGKFLGKIAGLLFVAYVVFYTGSTMREFLEMIKAYNLPHTPTSIIMISFLAVSSIGVYYGLESISRFAYLSFYSIIIGLIFLYMLAIPNYNLGYLSPYLGYGFMTTAKIGFLRSSAYSEVFSFAIIINTLQGYKNFKKAGLQSLLISGIVISVSLFCYIITFGYNLGQESLSGIFQLSRLIYYNRFFQRVESIFLFTWVISSLITVSFSMYLGITMYCKTFHIKNKRPLLIPLVLLVYMTAIYPENLSQVIQINMIIIRQYSSGFIFGFPLLVLIISFIRRKKGGKANAQKE